MEEIIFLILLLLSLFIIYCMYKLLKKRGLYFSLVILDIIAFVLTFKVTYVLKMNINIGIVPFIAMLSVLYIFITKHGIKEIKDIYKITLCANITMALFLIIMNYFVPAITETISINMQGTFEYNYKILIIYPFMTLLSQYTVTKLYTLVSQIQNNISISIILTYIITALIYTIIFYLICYINILTFKDSLFLGITTYIIGIIVTIINIIFVNFLVNKKVKK